MLSAVLGLWLAGVGYIWWNNVSLPTNSSDFASLPLESQLCVSGVVCVSLVLLGILANQFLYDSNPLGRTSQLLGTFSKQESMRSIQVDGMIEQYNALQNDSITGLESRNSSYTTLVNAYYGTCIYMRDCAIARSNVAELATMFYEWGWGQSFHFAYFRKGENFDQAIKRHEYYLAGRLVQPLFLPQLKLGWKLACTGCELR
jgi:hypothetical protein